MTASACFVFVAEVGEGVEEILVGWFVDVVAGWGYLGKGDGAQE